MPGMQAEGIEKIILICYEANGNTFLNKSTTMKIGLLFFVGLFAVSCNSNNNAMIKLDFKKDLIPEGIAIDPATNSIFLNSLTHNKIVKCHIDGSSPADFIKSNQYGYLAGFGMLVKGDTLFALGNSLQKKNSHSILLLLHVKNAALIKAYTLNDSSFHYLNDLAVTGNGDIFITDSESDKIYTVNQSTGALEIYLQSDEIAHSNGIAVSEDGQYLYLASGQNGIRILERATKKIINQPNLDYRGIDGMKFYKNSLVAIVNGKKDSSENGVFRFSLNREHNTITRKEKIIPFEDNFRIPTTFAILDGYLYFIINTQLDQLDEASGNIVDSNKLRQYELMKFKME
jgi:hypothetical protein